MAQNPPRLCSNCGTPVEPNQRFCSECGTTLNIASNQPTALASGEQETLLSQGSGAQFAPPPAPARNGSGDAATAPTQLVGAPGQASGSHFYSQPTDASPIPPPPPPDSLVAPLNRAFTSYQPFDRTPSGQPTPAPGTYSVPDYARAPRRSRLGMVVSLVLLLILVLGGVAVYALFFHKSNNNNQGNTSTQNTPPANGNTPASNVTATTGTGSSTPGSGSTSTTGNGATSEQLNLSFTFSGINLTINQVQYAQSYPDDNSITSGGVRVSLNENNTTSANPRYYYPDIVRLILPDNSVIAPSQEKQFSNPDAQSTAQNWLDFPVTSQPADLSQLTLQMGTVQQNQMLIPLKAGADLSKYQPKTSTPGTKFQYAGLNWTLKSATESYSIPGNQASSGNIYITVVLSVANPTSNDYSAYYGDVARLSVGSSTSSPTTDSNLPAIPSQTNATATFVFLAPQGSTSYILVMLATSFPSAQQVTVPFMIQ